MLIKIGSKGNDVKRIQELLGCTPDSVFGPQTDKLVRAWQTKHNLVADGVVGPATWKAMFEKQLDDVEFNPIDMHMTKSKREIKYLVIHYTAGASSKSGSALACRNVFLRVRSSADFAVDDNTMMQINPDPLTWYCWAVGDGKGAYGVVNKNCISIEMCSNLTKGTTGKVPNHEGWYFTEATINNTLKLCRMLMEKYNIPLENVIRHYDASHKLCPGVIGWNPGTIYDKVTGKATSMKSTEEKWIEFKKRLAEQK